MPKLAANTRNAIIFDHGGVIEEHNVDSYCRWLSTKCRLETDPRVVKEIYRKWIIQMDLDKIDENTFARGVCKDLDIKMSVREFCNTYYDKFTKPKHDVLKFIRKELYSKYPIFIFSNNNRITIRRFNKIVNQKKLFKTRVYSYNIKARKPDDKFFKRGLKLIKQKGINCIFIDDQLKSKEVSEENGITFIQFKNLNQLKKELRSLNIIN